MNCFRFFSTLLSALYFLNVSAQGTITTGADRLHEYIDYLQSKRVAIVVNQTSRVGQVHIVDTLLHRGVHIARIFAPEHGYRGDADAGAHIRDGIDPHTGIAITSLYGSHLRPSAADLADIDLVVFDIQDVGCRFYTFLSTLHYVIEACAEYRVELMLLDRPNPNGYYVDGPVLDTAYRSFVGVSPIPIVHGLTLGEYAQLVRGERWIAHADSLRLKVIPCLHYTHSIRYHLSIPPSPNLRNARAVMLYPSLCWFEGTAISVGRGTDYPFQVIGSPTIHIDSAYTFTPKPMKGATDPPHRGRLCYGYDLRRPQPMLRSEMKGVNLSYLIAMYRAIDDTATFFLPTLFFDRLAGTDALRKQIIAHQSEQEIRKSWQTALQHYKNIRKKYLLYRDFE